MGYAAAVHLVLQREYAPLRHAAKILARKADVSPRTAENWLAGTCAPRGDELLRLMASCDALAAEINKLVEELRKSGTPDGHFQP